MSEDTEQPVEESRFKKFRKGVWNRAGKLRRAVTPGEGAAAAARSLGSGLSTFGRNLTIAGQFAGKSKKTHRRRKKRKSRKKRRTRKKSRRKSKKTRRCRKKR